MSHPHLLALAYVYPPDAGSGTFRSLYFLNHLASQGFRVSVLTARVEDFHRDACIDEELVQRIHPSVTVLRCPVTRPLDALLRLKGRLQRGTGTCGASPRRKGTGSCAASPHPVLLKDLLTGLLTCPDQHAGWIPHAVRSGKEWIRREGVNCIYATGGPWSSLVAAALLRRITGIPLLVDFRDPWVSNPNFSGKPAVLKRLERKLESFVVKEASAVVANTDELRSDFMARYHRHLRHGRIHTITNGFERIEEGVPAGRGRRFTLVHAGALYLSRNPANLLEAVESLIREGLIDPECLRLRLVGGISVQDGKLDRLLASRELAQVLEIHARVPHQEVLSLQREADAFLLIQPDFPVQIPRKLFEYISLKKPVLAITERHSTTGNLVRTKGLGMVVENDTAAIGGAILHLYRLWEEGRLLPLALNHVQEFRNDVLAARLGTVIKEISGRELCR